MFSRTSFSNQLTNTIVTTNAGRQYFEDASIQKKFSDSGSKKGLPACGYAETEDHQTGGTAAAWPTDITRVGHLTKAQLPPMSPFGEGSRVWLDGTSRWPGGEAPVVPGEDMPLPDIPPDELPGA